MSYFDKEIIGTNPFSPKPFEIRYNKMYIPGELRYSVTSQVENNYCSMRREACAAFRMAEAYSMPMKMTWETEKGFKGSRL